MTPTCCLCGADETQGPLDPRRCYGHPPGSVRCVSVNECDLRAELRNLRRVVAEVARELECFDEALFKRHVRRLRSET